MKIRKFTESLDLTSNHKIGDKVTLDFYDAGKLNNCIISEVHFNESDVSYDIEITIKDDMKTIIKSVDTEFVKK